MVDFDYQVYTLPYCSTLSWAGLGWVGVPGSFLSITGSSYDQAFAHEVGHNVRMNYSKRLHSNSSTHFGSDCAAL